MGRRVAGGSLARSNTTGVCMGKRKQIRPPKGFPGWLVKPSEFEFLDDLEAIARERNKVAKKRRKQERWRDRLALKRYDELTKIIEADAERGRQEIEAAAKKLANERIERKLAELDEKMQSAIEADRVEARRVFTAYAQRVTAAFRNAVEREGKEREQNTKTLKRIEKDMERSRLHDERMKLIERGVLRGRRR